MSIYLFFLFITSIRVTCAFLQVFIMKINLIAKNPPKYVFFRDQKTKFFWEGAKGHPVSTPHPLGAFGASILAVLALDLAPK